MPAGYADAARKRDRAFVIAGIACITGIAWAYMIHISRDMGKPMEMEMGVARLRGSGTAPALSRLCP